MTVRTGSGGKVQISSSGNSYFTQYTTTSSYVEKAFGFGASVVTVTNDSATANDVSVSWDGATLDGLIHFGETQDFYPGSRESVYVKSATGGAVSRIKAS